MVVDLEKRAFLCPPLRPLVCALLVALTFGCRGEPEVAVEPAAAAKDKSSETTGAEAVIGWESLGEGLDVAKWKPAPLVVANVLRIDPRRWSLRALLARESSAKGEAAAPDLLTAEDFSSRTAAAAVVNGGFFDPEYRPMGLRISQGRMQVPLRMVDWGVFFIGASGPGLVHARDWGEGREVDFAVECGPRLIHGGETFKLKPNLHRRSVIGHTSDGMVVMVVTRDPIDLNTLAAALVKPVSRGGLGLHAALNLDGGPSTQMDLRGRGGWRVAGISGVADAVGVFPRGSAERSDN